MRTALLTSCFLVALFIGALVPNVADAQIAGGEYWRDVEPSSVTSAGARHIVPTRFRTLRADITALRSLLAQAPGEEVQRAWESGFIVALPLPDGGYGQFRVVESPIMEPPLALKYPEIRTYLGQGIDDPTATTRFDVTPAGVHAIIFTDGGTVYVDPYAMGTTEYYICYYKRDVIRDESRVFIEEGPVVYDERVVEEIRRLVLQGTPLAIGEQLRTYRTAVAATGEYTTFHGGTVSAGLAAIVTAMNRVNGIYEREVAARMVLVANNDLIVYTNASTDPYTNNNGSTMLGQNQSNLDAVIGSANYDIGHVFSTGGGGIAGLGVVCIGGQKARGVTGSPSPIGDPFTVDYVAHEMGHQFGANHTFNGNGGSCSGNRNASTAYEPGSGSTIMAYAGICSSQDLQPNSDDYFHGISIDEIVAYTTSGSGSTCPTVTSTGNAAPTVNAGVGGLTIPISTPFSLTGSASDPNGDTLRYCWEEFDLGPAGAPNSPSGNAPIFRSFLPTLSPQRIFPKLSNLLNNTQTIGEILPSYGRTVSFRLTARDYRAGGGGVGKSVTIAFTVTSSAGPFQVTSPNTAVTLSGGTAQTVTWNVASTNASPVNCANVKISLSTDGGQSWFYVLAASTPNDGSESVVLPNIGTTTARVKVEAEGNIFFDVSNVNFSITPTASVSVVSPNGGESWGVGTFQTITWTTIGITGNVDVEVSRNGGGSYETLFSNTANDGAEPWVVTGPTSLDAIVRVSSVSNPFVQDVSNGPFTINPGLVFLTKLYLRDAGVGDDSLEFGSGAGATDGIDPSFGEYELPPLPPTGVFDVRWRITGKQGAKRDIRDTLGGSQTQVIYRGMMQPGEAGHPFLLKWKPLELPAGTFILRDEVGGTAFVVNMKQQDSVLVTDPDIAAFRIVYSSENSVTATLQGGWNVVSLPVTVSDRRTTSVFPSATSSAFAFTPTGYVSKDTLDYGVGYWLKFASTQVVTLTGDLTTEDTIDVVLGWNIIGSISYDVPVDSIIQIPSGIVQSSYFGYQPSSGYGAATMVEPMKGYWVKVSQNGQLILRGSQSPGPASVPAGERRLHTR